MNKILRNLTFLLTFAWLLSQNCLANVPTSFSLAPMIEKASPAIVNIKAIIRVIDTESLSKLQQQKQDNSQIPDKELSIASGVIVDAERGYILTNAHVIQDAEAVTITLNDGHHYNAKIIGVDKASDIALLQIQAKNLTSIPIGNSNDLKVGDLVAAIGNPFGLSQTVTSGIVSALGRTTLGIESYENFIQTDAPINPGNSGGALINSQGELIGINTAILAPSRGSIGIGFAIPSNMAKSVMQQLIQYGNVRRGALGVGAQDITPDLSSAFHLNNMQGSVITLVMPNSPAEQIGLKVGDIITDINGNKVKNANDVVNAIGLLRVDSKANITILRNNKSMTLTTTISDPKKRKEAGEQKDPFFYGVSLKDFTLTSPMHGDIKGILVISVEEDSNAWHSDLHPGDIIISADQQKVTSIEELKKMAANKKQDLLLNVLRDSGAIFLVISKEP